MASRIERLTSIRQGYEDGVQWKLTFGYNKSCVNGYVKVPNPHEKMTSESYLELNYAVHGGLTYSDEEGWLGFDTAHYGDYWTTDELEKFNGKREVNPYMPVTTEVIQVWTLDLVEQEVINLARQVSGFKELT